MEYHFLVFIQSNFLTKKDIGWWTVYVGRSTFEKISKVSNGQLKLVRTSCREQNYMLA